MSDVSDREQAPTATARLRSSFDKSRQYITDAGQRLGALGSRRPQEWGGGTPVRGQDQRRRHGGVGTPDL
jgi:hypothetical protein